MQDYDLIGKELNKLFKNDMSTLNIKENSVITSRTSDCTTDSIDIIMDKYKFRLNILLIQKHLENHHIFSFKTVEIGDIKKEINNINSKKTTTNNSIPPKLLKAYSKV